MTSGRLSLLFSIVGNWIVGFILGMIFSWQLTLVVTAYMLFIVIICVMNYKLSLKIGKTLNNTFEQAADVRQCRMLHINVFYNPFSINSSYLLKCSKTFERSNN